MFNLAEWRETGKHDDADQNNYVVQKSSCVLGNWFVILLFIDIYIYIIIIIIYVLKI